MVRKGGEKPRQRFVNGKSGHERLRKRRSREAQEAG
jgi:hypothetical protein